MSRIPTATGWPFLVARGRRHGYRTVLAPQFLIERKLDGRLLDSTRPVGAEAQCFELVIGGGDSMTVLYRSDVLDVSDLAGAGDAVVTDEHGRPLELVYGIVTPDALCRPFHERDLLDARNQALDSYRRFLSAEDDFGVTASAPLNLQTAVQTRAALKPEDGSRRLHIDADAQRGPRPPVSPAAPRAGGGASALGGRAPMIVTLVVAAIAALLIAHGLWPDGHVIEVTHAGVEGVPAGTDCSAPVRFDLRVSVSASQKLAVGYHWTPSSAIEQPARATLALDGRNPAHVVAQTRPLGPRERGAVRFVIDSPAGEKTARTLELRCP